MTPVWIDTDMGFDDLAAICVVAASPQHRIAGLSLVAGNAPLQHVAANAAGAAQLFGWTFPIHLGREKPLIGKLATASYVLGPRGMASVGRHLPDAQLPSSSRPAWHAMADFVRANAGATILALGPLTNIAMFALNEPDLANRIGSLVWMGGGIGGNHSAAAEFNAAVDPESIAIVLESGIPLKMVGIDTCRQVRCSNDDAESLRAIGTERALIMADLLAAYAVIPGPGAKMAIYDPVAAAALVEPASLTFRPAHVEAELRGAHTRGMTVIEWRVPRKALANCEVSTQADEPLARRVIFDALAKCCMQQD
jgi:purine nucleosidase